MRDHQRGAIGAQRLRRSWMCRFYLVSSDEVPRLE